MQVDAAKAILPYGLMTIAMCMQVEAAKAVVRLMYEETVPPTLGAKDLVKVGAGRHWAGGVS
jgi:hypothetical protein